jgi:hypothetical protein
MQPEPRQVHICGRSGGVEPRQNIAQLCHVFGDHAARVIILIKPLQPFVPDGADHRLS